MPSSYTNNLGIELPADGELDGIWGDIVNDNMDILDRAINGSVTLTLSGTSSTLTTSDGTLSDGQYKVLVLAGSPSGTHTITIAPNDAQKIYFVRNTTAQSAVFTQGSGGNATIAAGDNAIIYSTGGGAASAVVVVVPPVTLAQLGITASASELNILDGVTASTAELNILDGVTASTAELNILDGVTASTAELNILDGVTTSTAELNILDGVTASTAELNLLDGVTYTLTDINGLTASIAELNVLDGITASTAELNILDGVTATASELNVMDGIAGIASQVEAEAGTATDKLMTPERTKQAIDALAPSVVTTSAVLTATASATAGGVGTYVFAFSNTSSTLNFGATIAGSGLRPSSVTSGGEALASSGLSGTWRIMGFQSTVARNSVFLRIS